MADTEMAETTTLDAAPAVKRRRLDDTEEVQPAVGASEKYKDLWLEDGNIILQCAQGSFRVHRSLLVAQSELFRDMFSLAIPDSEGGAPAVQLSDDTDKMYMFLRFLLLHDDPADDHAQFADQVLDIFELSNKYMISAARKSSVTALKRLFPDKLEDYQATVAKRRSVVSYAATIRCISLATTHGLRTLLPACYLHLADHFHRDIFDIKSTTPWPTDIPLTLYVTVVRSLRRLLRLKREVIDEFTSDWLETWFNGHKHRITALLDYFIEISRGKYYEDDLRLFQSESLASQAIVLSIEDVCDECLQYCDSMQRNAWVGAWIQLPSFLELGSWEAMREEERQASSASQ
ncbi:hypothetical protein PENSPDRAFT_758289 [Peniophora sp. CONT]|nr:hypothetical protein PENSPDRAFT_758289 [Peniophora sp. CONT]